MFTEVQDLIEKVEQLRIDMKMKVEVWEYKEKLKGLHIIKGRFIKNPYK